MGGRDQSQVKNKKFEKIYVRSNKTYLKSHNNDNNDDKGAVEWEESEGGGAEGSRCRADLFLGPLVYKAVGERRVQHYHCKLEQYTAIQ